MVLEYPGTPLVDDGKPIQNDDGLETRVLLVSISLSNTRGIHTREQNKRGIPTKRLASCAAPRSCTASWYGTPTPGAIHRLRTAAATVQARPTRSPTYHCRAFPYLVCYLGSKKWACSQDHQVMTSVKRYPTREDFGVPL